MKNARIRSLACILALLMAFSLLTSPAFAAENDPGDTYFSITESGSTQKYYGSIMLGDPVMTLEPDKTYHLELQWTFHSIDEAAETAKYVSMFFEYPQQCLKDGMYDLSANVYSSVVNSTYIVLSFWASDNIEIEDVAGSYRIYCDDLQDGSIADVYGLDLDWDYEIAVGDLANGHSCRLTFDIHTKPFVPTTDDQETDATDPVSQNGTNPPDDVTDLNPESSAIPDSETNGESGASAEPETSEEPYDPTLPRVFKGEVDSSNRELFAEENRPDYAVFNSVTDSPEYGDESRFIRITDLGSGKEYLEGTIQLVHGRQYQVQVFYRNDSARSEGRYFTQSRDANGAQLLVAMPYELAAGANGRISATISAENTLPLTVSAGLDLRSDYGVSLQYVEGSAVWQKNGSDKIVAIDYEELFRDGVRLGSIRSGVYGTVTFTIQVVADESVVADLPENEAVVNSNSSFGDKVWNLYLPAVVASVLITLLIIAIIGLLLPMFYPPLRSFPTLLKSIPMPKCAEPKPEDELVSAKVDAEETQSGDAGESASNDEEKPS